LSENCPSLSSAALSPSLPQYLSSSFFQARPALKGLQIPESLNLVFVLQFREHAQG
jgi:hypothetical protein